MSKQSQAKGLQGWRKKPDTCADCEHFEFEVKKKEEGTRWEYTVNANLRCALGGFKTGKSNTCNKFYPKVGEIKDYE